MVLEVQAKVVVLVMMADMVIAQVIIDMAVVVVERLQQADLPVA